MHVLVQVSSRGPAQFIVGRVLIYLAVGLVENVCCFQLFLEILA